jgi:hypothetical protein
LIEREACTQNWNGDGVGEDWRMVEKLMRRASSGYAEGGSAGTSDLHDFECKAAGAA